VKNSIGKATNGTEPGRERQVSLTGSLEKDLLELKSNSASKKNITGSEDASIADQLHGSGGWSKLNTANA